MGIPLIDVEGRASAGVASRRRRSAWARIEDGLLSVLATVGVICIVATIAAFALSINLIMFKTGSMSPTIPTGSLAVVRQIPASKSKSATSPPSPAARVSCR